jgi:hypothetical protein
MQGAERLRMCHNVLRHWLLIAQVWTQTWACMGFVTKYHWNRHYFILLLFHEANVFYKLLEKGRDISKYQSHSILNISIMKVIFHYTKFQKLHKVKCTKYESEKIPTPSCLCSSQNVVPLV